jgi:hypothetical protein
MPESVDEIARTLRLLQLRPLTRPSIGPDEPLTLDLVQFDLTAYAYSAIAYIRNLLDGLLVVWAANNVAAVDLVTRGLYEWTMHAAYLGGSQSAYRSKLQILSNAALSWIAFNPVTAG